MRDEDLDKMLEGLRKAGPTDLQMQKWKNAVEREVKSYRRPASAPWAQLIAASVVGFIIGAVVMSLKPSLRHLEQVANNDYEDATIEYVLTKTD